MLQELKVEKNQILLRHSYIVCARRQRLSGNEPLRLLHYENLPMQFTEMFFGCKNEKFKMKIFDILI